MAEPTKPPTIGELVAFYRRQRGWNRDALAMRLNRSYSWVEKIERGVRPVDSVKVVLELAETLGVPADVLLRKPLGPPPSGPKMDDPQGVMLRLRQALLHYNGISDSAPASQTPARPVAELNHGLHLAWATYVTDTHTLSAVVWLLPPLIEEARAAVEQADDDAGRRAAWRLMAGLYRLAAWEMRHYGDDALAWISAHRAIDAAERADDPLSIAAGARAMQQVLLGQGHLEETIAVADGVGRLIDPLTAPAAADDEAVPDAQWCVWGTMQLIAALAAARGKDNEEAEHRWGLVEEAAEQFGRNAQWESLWFGPANVAIQRVATLVEMYEPKAALEVADRLPADPLPEINRRAYFRLHQGKAQFLRRQDDDALRLLVEAERVAPEIVRYEAMVPEILRATIRRRRTKVPNEVRALATRLQVAS